MIFCLLLRALKYCVRFFFSLKIIWKERNKREEEASKETGDDAKHVFIFILPHEYLLTWTGKQGPSGGM